MFKLLKNFKKIDFLYLLIITALIFFQVYLDLKLPDYMSSITVLVKTEGSKMSDILSEGGKMLLCAGGSLLSAIVVSYFTSLVSARYSRNLREKLFKNVESFGMEQMKQFSTGSLITRTTNDITNVQMFISMGMQMLIKAPITAVWAIMKILNKNLTWSIMTGGFVIALLVIIAILMSLVLPKFKIIQKLVDKVNSLMREELTGIRVVRAFNAEKYQEDKFEKINDELTNTNLYTQTRMSIMSPVMYLIMNLLTLEIYFLGAGLIENAALGNKIGLFSDMVVFSSYAMQVIMSFLMLAVIFIMYPRASISMDRIEEVINTKSKITDGKFLGTTKKKGEIEFKKVSFKYPDADEYVLKDISFKAKKGETIAFIGSTGSGKSTLLNLISRFYDVTEGEVLVDGVDVKDYKLSSLHNKLGYVSQKAMMFGTSIENNISYGDNGKGKITNKKIKDALNVSESEEFVSKLKGEESFVLAEGATNVSGGQKQRLSIARAIARDPEIYLFDDTFSALDYKTDAKLRSNLKKYTKDATILIVAQRIGTIMNADKIIVLDDGKVVGMGRHKDLLKNCPVYKEIAYSQLGKEELENA